MVSFPLSISGHEIEPYYTCIPQFARPISEALQSINGHYATVYGYEATDTTVPWKVYDVSVPNWVNDLDQLRYEQGYWINVS